MAPLYIEGALADGVLNLGFSNSEVYGGKADGVVTIDVSKDKQQQALNMNLQGVQALPLLSALADFRELDGKMSGKIDVRATGASARAIMGSLDGTINVQFQDGQIRGLNVAEMMRTLTKTTLNGWEKKRAEKTDLSELSALFKIDRGIAKTDNLKLFGPLVRVNGSGTADLANKTLNFKLDSKLVTSLEGQGGPTNPTGFGVPIMVEGKWDSPKIYPDMAGILDNPQAAYSKLNDIGAGLFGNAKGGGGSLLKGLGDLFKNTDNKDDQAPVDEEKKSPPQATQPKITEPQETRPQTTQPQTTQPQNAQTQNTPPPASKPQDAQAQDDKAKDKDKDDDEFDEKKTRAKIKDLLKNIFGQ